MRNFILGLTSLLPLAVLLFGSNQLLAQTWSDQVAQLTYDKCAKCHHTGGIAPFSLTKHSEVVARAASIQNAITTGIMPPSPPDENYQQYAHSKSLSSAEKAVYLQWLSSGAPEGNAGNTPPIPIFSDGSLLGNGDLEVKIPTYRSKASAVSDDYACFSIPSGLAQDRTIKWVEIIPGNREIVHHALIFIDPLGIELTDTIGGDCSSPANTTTKLIAAYIPGSDPLMLPSSDPLKLGFSMPANSNVYFAMHYPDGSFGQADSTKVIFHFYPLGETGIREVFAESIIENWNFSLPANQITTVNAAYNQINIDYSMLSVFPHMHLLGKTIKSYAIKPNADTLKFVSIPNWDFHWQGFYFFKKIQHLPAGSIIRAQGTYDNTTGNPNNPSNPPVLVIPGLNTKDEMFLVYFHYLPYIAGDETYDLEALMTAELTQLYQNESDTWTLAPNPFDQSTTISLKNVKPDDQVSVSVFDSQGQLVNRLCTASLGKQNLVWNGCYENGTPVAKGLYHFSVNVNGEFSHKAVVKQ